MNLLIIILVAIVVLTIVLLYVGTKYAYEVKEDPIKFQPRQMTVIGKEIYTNEDPIEVVKPKRKYKKRKSKKKVVLEVEKKPVGRPRISK